jgi:hypothetical protein
MRALSVGALFKNEERALPEWIEHYLHHGAEHFYLIDDNSDDRSCDVVKPYVDHGLVSLFREKHPYYLGRQRNLYNKHILPRFDETHWLLICDLDEFVWSPRSIDLRPVLAELDHIAQVQMIHTLFGSNGRVTTPAGGLVASYTRRASSSPTRKPGNFKYFLNSTRAACSSLNVHHATFTAKEGKDAPYYIMNETGFVLNHYCCQSREFWQNTKCTRGDADSYRVRTMKDFATYDLNDVKDTRPLEQNKLIKPSAPVHPTMRV